MRVLNVCLIGTIVLIATLGTAQSNLNVVTREENAPNVGPSNGVAVDEVIVESSLYIKSKPKANARKVRSIIMQKLDGNSFVEHKRVKRLGATPSIAKTTQQILR